MRVIHPGTVTYDYQLLPNCDDSQVTIRGLQLFCGLKELTIHYHTYDGDNARNLAPILSQLNQFTNTVNNQFQAYRANIADFEIPQITFEPKHVSGAFDGVWWRLNI
jgi:hypothetical protein